MENKKINIIYILTICIYLTHLSPVLAQAESQWSNMGIYGGQMTSIAIDYDDPDVLYAGSWMGDGLFKSTNKGEDWFNIPVLQPSWFRNYEVFDVDVDPNDSLTIWVANNHFVDVSYDGGASWKTFLFASDEDRFCYSVAVDPHDITGETVYVGTGGPDNTDEYGEIFVTYDGGNNWEKMDFITGSDVWNNFWDISFSPHTVGEIWIANRKSQLSPDGLIYMTDNYGYDWWFWQCALDLNEACIDFGYMDEVKVHPQDPHTVFISSEYGVARKTDGTNLSEGYWFWTEIDESCRALTIPPTDPNTLYAGLVDQIAKSTDSGKTWETFYDAPAEFLSLETHPTNSEILYGGSINSGLYKSTTAAQSWQPINNGIRANTIYDTAISAQDNTKIICGTLAGIFLQQENNSWSLIESSQSEAVTFHPENDSIIYAGFGWSLGKSTDNGRSWSYFDVSDSNESHGVSAVGIIPGGASDNTIIAGVSFDSGTYGEIQVIKESAEGFVKESFVTSHVPVNTIAVHPTDKNVVFAGTGSFYGPVDVGGIYKSTDGGYSWQDPILYDLVVNSISISESNPLNVFAACGGSDGSYAGIYKSSDGGAFWELMENGLPANYSVADITVDASSDQIIYAALYKGYDELNSKLGGTYVSINGGSYWSMIGLSDYLLLDVNHAALSNTIQTSRTVASPLRQAIIPSSTVFAGTGSGLYTTSTAGTGIITGTVSSVRDTGPIDAAVVGTNLGVSGISSQGYYLLLVPSGVHTLTASHGSYENTSVASIQVQAGQSVEQDIVMTPVKATNNGNGSETCIASYLVPKQQVPDDLLQEFRAFRDSVLKKTALGRYLIKSYYTFGKDIIAVLQQNLPLKQKHLKYVLQVHPEIRSYLQNNRLHIKSRHLTALSNILYELERYSPHKLSAEISKMRLRLRSFTNSCAVPE